MAVKKNTLQTLDAGTDKDYLIVPINKKTTTTTTTTKAVTPTTQTTSSAKNSNSAATGALSANNKLLASANPVAYEGGTGVGTVVNKSLGNGNTNTTTAPKTSTTSAPAQTVVNTTPTVLQTATPVVETAPAVATAPAYVAPTATAAEPYKSNAVKPTYQASTAEKPTYTSNYSGSSYTPQTYEAASYGGMGFSGRTYQGKTAEFNPSQQYLDAYAEVERLLEQVKGGRTSYTDKITDKLAEIENTKPFEYDFNKDPLFQNMLTAYMRDGRVAMQDTMGQAAALTGGYGSSYSQAVGNQAYNRMVQEAYDNLPEYYDRALAQYQMDLQNKYNLLGEYRASDATEYERMLNDFNNQFGYANDMYNKEYNKFWDETNFAEQSRQWAQNLTEQSAQHAESLSAQTSMHAQSLTEQARQWAAEMNQNEQRYADSLARAEEEAAYNRYRDELNDYYRQQELDYNRYRDEMGDYYRDLGFDYDRYRDSVSDARYADQTAYDRYRDSVSDARYADQLAYDREQDAISNALAQAKFNDSSALDWANYNLKKEAQAFDIEQAKNAAKSSGTNYESFSSINADAKHAAQNMTEAQYWAWADKQMQSKNYDPSDFDRIWDTYGSTKGNDSITLDKNGFYYDSKSNKQVLSDQGNLVQPYFYPTSDPNVFIDDYGNPYDLSEIRRYGFIDRIIKG